MKLFRSSLSVSFLIGILTSVSAGHAQELEHLDGSGAASETTAPEIPAVSTAVRDALADLDLIVAELARVRGVQTTGPVQASSRDRESLREQLVAMIEREFSAEEVANDEASLRFLQVLDADESLIELTLSLLESQVAGYYDHEADEFFIIDDADPDTVRMITAHELFHAIQDQVWDLSVVQGPNRKVTDIALARAALIEGDATDVMVSYLLGGQPNPLAQRMMLSAMQSADPEAAGVDVPALMWEQLIAPYVAGLGFVTAVRGAGGLEALDAAYLDPPQSTEQILHPERYLDRDDPVWLDFLPQPPAGYELLDDDVMGELSLGAWLRGLMSGLLSLSSIERAATGWDGDRFRLYRRSDADVVVWLFAMDSDDDARGLGSVLARVGLPLIGEAAAPVGEPPRGETNRWRVETAMGALLIVQRDSELLWLMEQTTGVEGSLSELEALGDDVWDTVTRATYPPG